jgi:hypothetical protein
MRRSITSIFYVIVLEYSINKQDLKKWTYEGCMQSFLRKMFKRI